MRTLARRRRWTPRRSATPPPRRFDHVRGRRRLAVTPGVLGQEALSSKDLRLGIGAARGVARWGRVVPELRDPGGPRDLRDGADSQRGGAGWVRRLGRPEALHWSEHAGA